MSNEPQKADQIAFHFYTKLFYVVNHARATADPRTTPRIDKWFNLETPDSDLFPREAKEKYKSISASPSASPMEIQVLLCIPELTNKEVLVHVAPDGSRTRIDPTPHHILLESWTLTFSPRRAGREDNLDIALPTIYKHGIPLFRSLFTLLRILPAWSMHKRIKRRTGGPNRNGHLSIKLRVLTGSEDDSVGSLLGFDTPPSSSSPPLQIQSHAFAAVPHPLGTLSLTGAYLTDPNFQLDELESLLSDRFLTLDEGLDFVPTLMKNQSLRSSGVPTGTSPGTRSGAGPGVLSTSPRQFPPSAQRSKSKSPPESIADRFILRSRTSSIVSNPSPGPAPKAQLPPISTADHFNQPLSPSHYRRDSLHVRHASTPVPNTSSSPFPSRDREEPISPISPHPRPPSGLGMNRLRRESAGGVGPGPLGELPSSPSASTFSLASNGGTNPLPIRRSHLNPVNPFKSNTLSSPSSLHSVNAPSPAPSVRGGSPLTVGVTAGTPGSPAIPRPTPSPTTRPSSGLGIPIPPVPGTMRQSPPFGLSQGTPSSLGERRSLRSGEGVTAGSPSPGEESQSPSSHPSGGLLPSPARSLSQRKRYSSSFGHRYAPNAQVPGTPTTAGGALSSEGSPSPSAAGISVPKKDDKARLAYMAARTEDDDLSVFIKTIDEAKPLTGRVRIQEDRERDRDGTEREGSVERRREASLERGARVDRGLSPKSPLAVISQEEGESDENVEKQEGEEARPSVLPDGGLGLGDLQVQQQRLPTRAPLNPAGRTPSSPAPAPPIPTTITATATGSPTTGLVPSGLVAPGAAGPSTGVGLSSVPIGSPPGGLVLTSQYEVEAKLKRMNETFKASLEGFEEMVARRDGMKGKAKAANAVDRKPRSASGDSEGHSVTIEVKGPHGHGSSHAQAEREPTRLIGEVGRTGSDEHYGYPYPVPYPPYLGSGHGSAASGSNSGSSGMASAGQGSDEVIGKMDLGESEKRRRSGLSGLRH